MGNWPTPRACSGTAHRVPRPRSGIFPGSGRAFVCLVAVTLAAAAGRSEAGEVMSGAAAVGFCRFDLDTGVSVGAPSFPTTLRHCTCLEKIDYFTNGDQRYDMAVGWTGEGLEAGNGAFAEYYETPEGRAGAICQLVLHLTDKSAGTRGVLDVIVWEDADGLPGAVLGVLPATNILTVAPFPSIGTKIVEVYEVVQIGVQGGFWVGFHGGWDLAECSVLLAVDTIDEDPGLPALHRGAATLVGPGADGPEGWRLLEDLLGVPAASGISVVVGWCPVPVETRSWGEIKRLYDR